MKAFGGKIFIFLAAVSIFSVGCQKTGLSTSSLLATEAENRGLGSTSEISETDKSIPESLSFKGNLDGGQYDGSQIVVLDRPNKALLFNIPLALDVNIGIAEGEIKKLPGTTFKTSTNADGARFLSLSIPLKYILRGTDLVAAKLPNGDDLPAVPQREYPSLGLSLPNSNNVKIYLYLGVQVAAVFVETPFNPYIDLTLPIRNEAKTRVVGHLGLVPAKNSFRGGVFVSSVLPNELAQALANFL